MSEVKELSRSVKGLTVLVTGAASAGAMATTAELQRIYRDMGLVAGTWAFVVSRLLHSWVHVTSNVVRQRFNAFLAGVLILMAMWVWLALRVFGGL
mgnify:CR=1 FL=1